MMVLSKTLQLPLEGSSRRTLSERGNKLLLLYLQNHLNKNVVHPVAPLHSADIETPISHDVEKTKIYPEFRNKKWHVNKIYESTSGHKHLCAIV